MIPRIGEIEVTRTRFGGVAKNARGFRVKQDPADETVRIVTDQAPRSVIERLPEGVRARDVLFFITYDDVRMAAYTGDGVPEDRLTVDGRTYDVQEVWTVPAWMGDPAHLEGYATIVQPRTAS